MKRFVNGQEVEWRVQPASITRDGDRVLVHTAEGVFSGLAVKSGDTTLVSYRGQSYEVRRMPRTAARAGGASSGELRAPMPGMVVEVFCKAGDAVDKGDKVVVMEAMKTQQTLAAPFPGVVETVTVEAGMQVVEGQVLAVVKPLDGTP